MTLGLNLTFYPEGSAVPKVRAGDLVEARRQRSRQFREPALPPRFPTRKAETRGRRGTPRKIEAATSTSLPTTRLVNNCVSSTRGCSATKNYQFTLPLTRIIIRPLLRSKLVLPN